MRLRGSRAAIAASAGLITGGCGTANNAPEPNAGAEETSTAKQVRASRALTKSGSPGAVVTTFIQDLRDGAGPAVFSIYDRRVPDRVGTSNVLGAMQVMAELSQGARPVVMRHRRRKSGQLVVVRLLRPDGLDMRHSFLLRRNDGRWTILYDSFLAQALPSYIASQRSSDPTKPSPSAKRAAARAMTRLRLAAVTPPRRARPARRRQASPRPGQAVAPIAPRTPGTGTQSSQPAAGTSTTGR